MRAYAIRPLATAAVSATICLSTACTTLSPVRVDTTGERIRAEIKAGDTVRVVTADGTTHSLRVSTVGASSLVGDSVRMWKGGTDVAGMRIELPYADLRQMDVQRVSGLKTTAIVAAVGLAAAVAIATGGGSHTPGYTR